MVSRKARMALGEALGLGAEHDVAVRRELDVRETDALDARLLLADGQQVVPERAGLIVGIVELDVFGARGAGCGHHFAE